MEFIRVTDVPSPTQYPPAARHINDASSLDQQSLTENPEYGQPSTSTQVRSRLEENEESSSLAGIDQVRGIQASTGDSCSQRQILTLVTLCLVNVFSALFGSLIAPFFPTEAKQKGVSQMWVGLIFGCYQLIVFICSPIWGNYMTRIGPKFMYVTGILVCSSCAILFGVLEWCPPGVIYIVMCFLCRSLEAVASAAASTATLAIATHTFPTRISTVMGLMSGCSQIGLILGPPVGGALYSWGGFHLPFFVSGASYMCIGLFSACLLPSPHEDEKQVHGERNLRLMGSLLCTPAVIVIGYMVFIGQCAIGFLDVTLALHLIDDIDENISHTVIGLIFLIPSGIVVILAPLYGHLVDKHQVFGRPLMLLGSLMGAAGFLGLGPSPLLTFIPKGLNTVMISLAISAMGWAALVLTYQEFIIAARKKGFDQLLDTQAVISGLYNAFGSFGAFLGPTAGGFLNEAIEFPWSSTIIAFMAAFASLMLLCLMICEPLCCPGGETTHSAKNEDEERILDHEELPNESPEDSQSSDQPMNDAVTDYSISLKDEEEDNDGAVGVNSGSKALLMEASEQNGVHVAVMENNLGNGSEYNCEIRADAGANGQLDNYSDVTQETAERPAVNGNSDSPGEVVITKEDTDTASAGNTADTDTASAGDTAGNSLVVQAEVQADPNVI